MARTKISEFSATPADNTDIDNINIAEGCAPSGINNAIRELMAQLKEMQTGASGDTFTFAALNATTANIDGGTVDGAVIGGTTPAAATFTTAAVESLTVGGSAISPQTGFVNRIINGDMRIDQRNAGASVTPTDGQYTLDRWICYRSQASKYSVQQNAGSVTPPVGFSNYFGVTSLSAYSVVSGDYFAFQQRIEGFNFADCNWGTANAQAVTLSFRVYSSLTGTFGGSLLNSADNRSYPFSFTVSSANTWTSVSVTIPGDTTGTWIGATNGTGVKVTFSLGCGSTFSGTANTWQAGAFFQPTGATSLVGTNGATFYITGVQVEKGSTATPFEFRSYGQELALCQRYLPAFMSAGIIGGGGTVRTSTIAAVSVPFPVQTRVAPTGITTNTSVGVNYAAIAAGGGDFTNMAITFSSASNMNSNLLFTNGAATMTVGHGIQASLNSVGYVYFNGCEL